MSETGSRRALSAVFFSMVSVALAPAAQAMEYRAVPQLFLSEEYNDNIFEHQSGRTECVTRVQPSLGLQTLGKGAALDLNYGLDYRHYARGLRDDELDHRAGFNAKLMPLDDEFLALDLGETYSRISLNITRNVVAESLVANQTEQSAAFLSPYLNWRLGDNGKLKTGYRFSDTRYWSSQGIDKQEQDGFAELTWDLTPNLKGSGGYNFAYTSAEPTSYRRHDLYAGFRYDVGEGAVLFAKGGNNWQRFSNGVSESHLFWDAGASCDLRYFKLAVGTAKLYSEDPQSLSTRTTKYDATLTRTFKRGALTLSGGYSEYEARFPETRRRYKGEILATANYELSQGLVLRLNASGDHVTEKGRTDYPYHLQAGIGLDYSINRHTVLGAQYMHVSYRNKLDSTTGAAEVNRAIVEVRLSL